MGYGLGYLTCPVVDVSADGNYAKDEASSLEGYQLHMLKIQNLMVDEFGVKARNNDMLGSMSDLAAKLGGSGYAKMTNLKDYGGRPQAASFYLRI